jgi:hypothetical protein
MRGKEGNSHDESDESPLSPAEIKSRLCLIKLTDNIISTHLTQFRICELIAIKIPYFQHSLINQETKC